MKRKLLLLLLPFLFFAPCSLLAQCPSLFYDGFESGNWTPTWTAGTGTVTRTVTTTSPAVGNYCFSQEGSAGHFTGIYNIFGSSTPPSIGVWVKTTDFASNSAYVVIGDANIASNAGIIFFNFTTSSQGRVYATASLQYTWNATINTWYHLEFQNMDYVNKTYDLYLDGVLVAPAFPFRSQTSPTIDRIHLYNFSGNATAFYDDVNIGGSSLNITTNPTDVLCDGDSTGTAMATANGGTTPYTYSWSNGGNTQTVANLMPGTYNVSVTDSLGCTGQGTAVVGAPPAITSSAVPSDALCNGDTTGAIDLSVSGGVGGYSYLWSNASTQEDPSGLSAGTYTVAVTDSNGCSHADTALVGEPTAIALSAAITNVSCNGAGDGAIDLTPGGGTPGYTYTWNTSATSQDISGLSGGTYTVFVSDSNGCSTGDIYTVVDPPAITLGLQPSNVSCFGANDGIIQLTVNGGTPAFTYAWSNSTTAQNASNLAPGTYSVLVTDSSGCTGMDSATITQPTQLIASGLATPDNGSGNGSVDLTVSGGNPGYTFSWTGPGGFTSTSEDISALAAGTYVVVVTDLNGCATSQTFVVSLAIGLADALNGPQVNVAPNPSSGMVRVQVTLAELSEVQFALTDLRGRVIHEATEPAAGLQLVRSIDLSGLAPGIYMLKVNASGTQSVTRVVRQ